MKSTRRTNRTASVLLVVFTLATLAWVLPGCHSSLAAPQPLVHHQAMISRPGESIYIDRVSNSVIMKETGDSVAKTSFCSFLIGWQDSTLNLDKDQLQKREKYFQYDMQKDWVALVQGDSVYPVLFQEKPGLDQQLKQGVLVFEMPKGLNPQALVYKDHFSSWGVRLFFLNPKSLNRQ